MRRGDVVTVAVGGDYGKPRPAVIVQTDALPERHASMIVCPMTSDVSVQSDFRVAIEPNSDNGLRVRSQVMADKPVTIRRERLGPRIGRLNPAEQAKLNTALAFALGLSGSSSIWQVSPHCPTLPPTRSGGFAACPSP